LRSCRAAMTVVPAALRAASRSLSSTLRAMSRLAEASSRISTSAVWARARAMQTRWNSPPESAAQDRSASRATPVSAMAVSAMAVSLEP